MFAFKKKILWLILACTLLTAFLVGGVSIHIAAGIVNSSADDRLRLQCERTAADMNGFLNNFKRDVNVALWLLRDNILAERNALRDPARLQNATEAIIPQVAGKAPFTPGCVAAYVRYRPEFKAEGFLLVLNRQGRMERQAVTDLSRYDPDDMERVGWFYEPLKAESPEQGMWIGPYYNANFGKWLISYVRPLIFDGKRIGVVGVDVEPGYFSDFVMDLHVYETGYAFLVLDGKVRVHRDYKMGTELAGQPELQDFLRTLAAARARDGAEAADDSHDLRSLAAVWENRYELNGVMKNFARTILADGSELFLCAPATEIHADSDRLIKTLGAIILLAVAVVFGVMNYMLNRLVKMATTDALTRLANRERFAEFFRTAQESDKPYAFFLLDADKFKRINDTYGHDQGDRVLRRIAKALQGIEKGGIVARWGGDEFIGILPFGEARARLAKLCAELTGINDPGYGTLSVSVGACKLEKGLTQDAVTKVADVALYEAKQQEGISSVKWVNQ